MWNSELRKQDSVKHEWNRNERWEFVIAMMIIQCIYINNQMESKGEKNIFNTCIFV